MRFGPSRLTGLWMFAVALTAADSLACAPDLAGRPLLGTEPVQFDRAAPLLLRVQQNDLDIEVLVSVGSRSERHDAPGGRNGIEWIYLPAGAGRAELCIYAVYRQTAPDSYTITSHVLKDADPRLREAFRLMDEAGARWAEGSREA